MGYCARLQPVSLRPDEKKAVSLTFCDLLRKLLAIGALNVAVTNRYACRRIGDCRTSAYIPVLPGIRRKCVIPQCATPGLIPNVTESACCRWFQRSRLPKSADRQDLTFAAQQGILIGDHDTGDSAYLTQYIMAALKSWHPSQLVGRYEAY